MTEETMTISNEDINAVNNYVSCLAESYEAKNKGGGFDAFLILTCQAFCAVAVYNGFDDESVHQNVQAMLDKTRETHAQGLISEGNNGGH